MQFNVHLELNINYSLCTGREFQTGKEREWECTKGVTSLEGESRRGKELSDEREVLVPHSYNCSNHVNMRKISNRINIDINIWNCTAIYVVWKWTGLGAVRKDKMSSKNTGNYNTKT
jgi:hypothetical protein